MSGLEILDAGALVTVQDRGRVGAAHLGVPRAGAADLAAHDAANALVGNDPSAATLEATMLGVRVRARGATVLAVTGARCEVFVGGVRAPWGAPFRVGRGQVVEVGAAVAGARAYVAVRGGIDVAPVLGSRSADTLSGLGPAPVRAGDVLPVGEAPPRDDELFRATRGAAAAAPSLEQERGAAALSVVPGPRWEWLGARGWATLLAREWTVSVDSNRVGVRLAGESLARARAGEIPSEGMVRGAVQLPPSGLPVIFLADHPTTGGYPVVAIVREGSHSRLAQARPGDTLRLVG
ncbi:biotin-dependent carboxyltransferase family protein [Demequina lignilytica]|uniref:Biotin-dependent carboxyltransferase family protein n=1 Tax=Demequina lignilytica TaxID=3051663 RepID=A0AAW7M441_9MICO|nr:MULTISPECIES: biotin-dependent carboxyltransferase family protein [unclassified Demequina]MDN4478676.1 biotin-dependent carboxyltransferase family protein [Demequina sp. SYSU T00039-1]MDN4483228.1 biotin-dependent carboxyltransferase family protein [Demequina sp. SYSU T0a273]MDN4488654.1 biotin-dependent carboxyltransferase family protein [Demequina sp. SYSU T00039]